MLRLPAAALVIGMGLHPAQAAPPARPSAPACATVHSRDTVTGLGENGEIRLASGRVIALLDVRLPDKAVTDNRVLAWLGSLQGEAVDVAATGEADRWGRVSAALALPGGIDIAELLVAEGFVLVSAEERDVLCRPELLALEARAREQRRGLWADAAVMPIAAEDMPALERQVGRFALIEGRVRSVGERAQRSYLNFGRFGEPGFTVTIPKKTWSRLRSQGVSSDKLRGRRIRVRGNLESWRGVSLELVVPSMLEVLDDKRP